MKSARPSASQAQLLIPVQDLTSEMDFFIVFGFRLEQIYPADDPAVAVLSGHGLQLRLDRAAVGAPPVLHLLSDHPEEFPTLTTSPGGTQMVLRAQTYQLHFPPTAHHFEVRRLADADAWVIGRAGMLYRDLVPNRLRGSMIASHIRIPEGGPVPDMVHYHTIGFQLIYCLQGWVKLVYEDQGPPFILHAGECVTQPPEIRHRVLEASDGLEVIEIGVPADHMTTIDHTLELPTDTYRPERKFQGQRFCRHQLAEAVWQPWRITGFEYRDTGVEVATAGMADVKVIRNSSTDIGLAQLGHTQDILFTFVLAGSTTLIADDQPDHPLTPGDAFVIPPNWSYQLSNCSEDLEFIEISLP